MSSERPADGLLPVQEQLRRVEARNSAILETALDSIITIDHLGVVLEFNPAAERTFGYTREQAIGSELAELIVPPWLRDRHRHGLARYVETGHGQLIGKRIEITALHAEGHEFPVELAITRIPVDGPPVFTAYLRDISDRVRNERYRNLRLAVTQILAQPDDLETAATGVLRAVCEGFGWEVGVFWIRPPGGEELQCLQAWHAPEVDVPHFEAASRERTFRRGEGLPGLAWERAEAVWMLDVLSAQHLPRSVAAAQSGLRGALAFPLRGSGGTLGVLEFFSQRIREPGADLLETLATVGGLAGQLIERRQREDALRESRERLDMALDAANMGHWTLELADRTTWRNRRHDEIFGYPTPLPEWTLEMFLEHVLPEDRQRVADSFERAVGTAATWDVEFRIRRTDGAERWLWVRGRSYTPGGGTTPHLAGTVADITDRKQLEAELRLRMEELADADRRKDEFLAMLAHELRNPLAPIRTSLQILRTPRVDADTAGKVHAIMERQVQQLVRLVDDLLDVSRVMRGKIDLRREPVELATIIARAVETAQPVVDVHGHQLELSIADESLLVDVDPVRMTQVVGNLLTNAAKYTEARGRITLSATREGEEAVLRVRDTGIGIAPEMLPRIFGLFVQANHANSLSHGGLGVGLTLARTLLELHGGSVSAHSAGEGQGSEFVMRLPVLAHPAAARPLVTAADPQPIEQAGHRVLVVDDNADAAESLAVLLRLQGNDVRVSLDGESALETAREFLPRVILLDLGMPVMDGFEVARRLRAMPELRGALLAALTGWGQQVDRDRTAASGFDRHLVKPVQHEALQELLRDAVPARAC